MALFSCFLCSLATHCQRKNTRDDAHEVGSALSFDSSRTLRNVLAATELNVESMQKGWDESYVCVHMLFSRLCVCTVYTIAVIKRNSVFGPMVGFQSSLIRLRTRSSNFLCRTRFFSCCCIVLSLHRATSHFTQVSFCIIREIFGHRRRLK